MNGKTRAMRLNPTHVARVARAMPDPGPQPGFASSTEEDYRAYVRDLLAAGEAGDQIWIFAYGSLIWNPACAFVEIRTGMLHGWHRSFCLGWNTRHRGSDDNPGLMLALDRGGRCKGALYRLPPDAVEENLDRLVRREMSHKPLAFPPRWVNVATADGPIRAITFCIDRNSGRYVSGLTDEAIAEVLARAVGSRGSMAEYLYHTVSHLQAMGIHDARLWRLQDLVAERIEALSGQ